MDKTVCELFAGVGGFRLGLERTEADWKTVWFSQWEPGRKSQWAHDCYVAHWGDIDANTGIDIAQVDKAEIPDHNLLVGGFPCQDYSVAKPLSASGGIEGEKGVLWWQICDVLKVKQAPFVLLENVDRLLKSPAKQRGRDFGVMLACLSILGYDVEWRVVNAAEYGAGQRRRRTFIFAYRNYTKYSLYQTSLPADVVLKTNGFFASVFPIQQEINIRTTAMDYRDIKGVSDNFKYPFGNAGYCRNGVIFTADVLPVEEKPIPLGQLLQTGVDKKYYLGDDLSKWQYLKGAKRQERTSKSGNRYIFSEGAVGFPDSLDKPARTMLTSEGSVNRSTHVVEDPETGALRILTPMETERIQGFDNDWTNTGMPERFRYFCMGNALVVPMVTRMGNYLSEIFEQE